MKRRVLAVLCAFSPLVLVAQETVVAPATPQETVPVSGNTVAVGADQRQPVAVFHVNVVSRTTEAINYRYRSGATHVNFKGTELMPKVDGKARVQSAAGKMDIQAELAHLQPPTTFGPEYLTYVLWAITPEGRAVNL